MNGVSPVLVGRSAELAVLEGAFAGAKAGKTTAVLVGGEAGIGKSRFVREFTARADDVHVLVGGCLELGAEGFPFAPFSAVLRQLVRETGIDGVTDLLPAGASRGLARLLPDFGEPETEPDTGSAAAGARARLFEQMLMLFERLAERTPTVVVIEDAHWADRSTRDLLAFLIRNLGSTQGLLFVVTYRSDDLHRSHPLRPLLAELGRLDGVERLELERLSRRNVAELAAGILGREPGYEMLDNAYRRSEGNPFFVEAILSCDTDGACEGLPESLRDLLLGGIERLPEETQDVLRVASVGGVRIDHELLAAVIQAGGSELSAKLSRALRPAVEGNVLTVDGDTYAFRHSLIREAIHDDLLPGEHTRLHTRYAEALEKDPSLGAAAELAHHWYAAHDATWALVSAWKAATVAKNAAAYSEWLDMLSRVLKLWDKVPDAADRIGAGHLTVLSKAVMAAHMSGENHRGLAFVKQALKDADSDRDRTTYFLEMRARLKSRLGLPGVLDDLREAVRVAPADPPGQPRASALATLATHLGLVSADEEGRAVAEEALAVGRATGSVDVEVHALTTLATVGVPPGDLDRMLADLAAARVIAQEARLPRQLLRIATNESNGLEGAGEHARAIEVARRGVTTSHEYGLARTQGAFLAGNVAEPLFCLGRWDEALEVLEHALDLAPPALYRAALLRHRGSIALARGDLVTAAKALAVNRETLKRSSPEAQFLGPPALLEIELRLAEGDPGKALDALLAIGESGCLDASPRYYWPVLVAGAEACLAAAGDPALHTRARSLLERHVAVAGKLTSSGRLQEAYRLTFETAASAAASALLGEAPGGQADAWDAVAAAWEDLGQPYPQARALLMSAEAVAAGGQRREASSRLRRAAELAKALSAKPLCTQIELMARRTGIPLAEAVPSDAGLGLTPRELEVLKLVAEGSSNRDIAGQLFISVKTASVHVSNILTKLGVSGRGEAAATAHRRGLSA